MKSNRFIVLDQVAIKEKHRGLLLRVTGAGGLWYGHVPGYQDEVYLHTSRVKR